MRLRTKGLLSLSAGLGTVALIATPAWAVNTSYIYYNTNPATQQNVLCQFGTSGNITHPSEVYRVRNNCSVRMWLHANKDGSGYTVCINPGTVADINRTYRQWQVTSNGARCT
jgi:hypothetical protein